jgi:hypothetical protein
MNAGQDDALRQELQAVLKRLRRMIADQPADRVSSMAGSTRIPVAVRNRVIDQQRRGHGASLADLLQWLNGLASIEYPLAGRYWTGLDTLRDGLKRLLEQGPRLQSQTTQA